MDQLPTSIVDYGNGIYAIDQQMVRAFLIVGKEKALLLDTVIFDIDINTYIKKVTDLKVEVVLTHGDGDHTGNLHHFSEAYINENEKKLIGTNEKFKDVTFHDVSEGDVFDLGGRVLKVLFTPGHTLGSICLIDEENQILFSGDTIAYGPIYLFGPKRNMSDYIHSLNRLKELRDAGKFKTVYCCHNECPISADSMEDLIACASGVQNGSIKGEVAKLPIPTEERIMIGKIGRYGILFQ